MAGYSKLCSSIITSSVWCEDDKTFRLWIAMLAMSDANGHVDGSVPGMARLINASVEDTERSIERLCSADPYSRTPDQDGRRLVPEPGGWLIVNYRLYRGQGQAKDGSRAEYFRDYRSRNKAQQLRNAEDVA